MDNGDDFLICLNDSSIDIDDDGDDVMMMIMMMMTIMMMTGSMQSS